MTSTRTLRLGAIAALLLAAAGLSAGGGPSVEIDWTEPMIRTPNGVYVGRGFSRGPASVTIGGQGDTPGIAYSIDEAYVATPDLASLLEGRRVLLGVKVVGEAASGLQRRVSINADGRLQISGAGEDFAQALLPLLVSHIGGAELVSAWVTFNESTERFLVLAVLKSGLYPPPTWRMFLVAIPDRPGDYCWLGTNAAMNLQLDEARFASGPYGLFKGPHGLHLVVPEQSNQWGSNLVRGWSFSAETPLETIYAFGTYPATAGQADSQKGDR